MPNHANLRYAVAFLLLLAAGLGSTPSPAQTHPAAALSSIPGFNQRLEDATRKMDNAATLALWADDGISLLPNSSPLIGKSAIAALMDRAMASLKGARMAEFHMQCSGVETSGDLASEWCVEHQIVTLPGKKLPFDGKGQMLLVLRRDSHGDWRLIREMWNQAAKIGSN